MAVVSSSTGAAGRGVTTSSSAGRDWRSPRPVDLRAVMAPLRRGGSDPAVRVAPEGVWWATSTPDGPGTLLLRVRAADGVVRARAWGTGAGWLLDGVPTLLGDGDDASGFAPAHPVVARAWHRFRGWRMLRTRRPFDAAVAAVIEQKVTGLEARTAWRMLLLRFGEPAPGTGDGAVAPDGLRVPPPPPVWREIPDWELRAAGVTPQRIHTLRVVAAASAAIDRTADEAGSRADAVLRALPGVGVWTAAEVRQRAHGDADAVSFGDFHVARDVCWWLTGALGDDEQMRTLLEPYAGHRYRVQRLMELTGAGAPRRGPRFAPPRHRQW